MNKRKKKEVKAMTKKALINEIQALKHEISERIERIETGNNSRENKNRDDYYNLMFNKLTKEERKIIFTAESIEYFDGLNAALNGIQLNLENILIRNGIKETEEK